MSDPSCEQNRLALPVGTVIGSYRICNVLGEGGFGITYLAEHTVIKFRKVALKEMLPLDYALRLPDGSVAARSLDHVEDFAWARTRFLEEAQRIVQCTSHCRHPNIVEVFDAFEANGTAYMVMSYEQGSNLEAWLSNLDRSPTEQEILSILLPLVSGLEVVHEMGLLHRDIKPDNIYICASNGRPVLLDFGAAREAIGSRSRAITTILTPGYAPIEQYTTEDGSHYGPWSDIYSLGATVYRMISGGKPLEAVRRLRSDAYVPLATRYKERYSLGLLAAVDHCLAVDEEKRPQSMAALRTLLDQAPERILQSTAPPKPLIAHLNSKRQRQVLIGSFATLGIVFVGLLAYAFFNGGEQPKHSGSVSSDSETERGITTPAAHAPTDKPSEPEKAKPPVTPDDKVPSGPDNVLPAPDNKTPSGPEKTAPMPDGTPTAPAADMPASNKSPGVPLPGAGPQLSVQDMAEVNKLLTAFVSAVNEGGTNAFTEITVREVFMQNGPATNAEAAGQWRQWLIRHELWQNSPYIAAEKGVPFNLVSSDPGGAIVVLFRFAVHSRREQAAIASPYQMKLTLIPAPKARKFSRFEDLAPRNPQ